MFDCMPWRKHLHAADDIFICIFSSRRRVKYSGKKMEPSIVENLQDVKTAVLISLSLVMSIYEKCKLAIV